MRIVLKEAEHFIDAISVINKVIAETEIKIDTEKLSIKALDPANVGMVVFEMDKNAFTEYEVDKEYKLGVKLNDLKSVLSRSDKKGSIELSVKEKLNLILKDSKGKRKEFNLSLIDLELKDQKIPELVFAAEVSLDNADLKESIVDASIASDSCLFSIDKEQFFISAKGDLTDSRSDTPGVVKLLGETNTVKSKYSIEYLDKMISTKMDVLKVFLKTEYPLKLSYTNKSGNIRLSWILAPRIEND